MEHIRGMMYILRTGSGRISGVDVNFVSTEAANRIEYLQTGKVDLILANLQ